MTPGLPRSDGGQPVLNAGLVGGLVAAVLGVVVAAGMPVSEALSDAILVLVATAVPVAVALAARRKVVPAAAVTAYRVVEGEVVAGPDATTADGTPVTVRPLPEDLTPS